MAITADKANVTTRAEKLAPLTYNEMDANFQEMKNVIDDAEANDSAIIAINSALSTLDGQVTTLENQQSDYLQKTSNLSDLSNLSLARSNLQVLSETESDNRYLQESANLSDIDNPSAGRTNLGIGDIATRDIFISTADPNNSNGDDGDIWLTYE
jgi:hypothetical protein